jgi:hypothetical protein
VCELRGWAEEIGSKLSYMNQASESWQEFGLYLPGT